MLAVWREWGLDEILKEAYKKNIIMSGVSAGAICWFEKGITDSWKDHQATIDCLGLLMVFVAHIMTKSQNEYLMLKRF